MLDTVGFFLVLGGAFGFVGSFWYFTRRSVPKLLLTWAVSVLAYIAGVFLMALSNSGS